MHAYKYCKLSTCLGHLQILVLGFCDNQRDEELIWKILSQVPSAACFVAISVTVINHLVADYIASTACFVHGFEAISMTVMHHCVADCAIEWWSGQENG